MTSKIQGPLILRHGKAIRLHRVPFGSHAYDEDWLQDQVYRNPSLLACDSLDPEFGGMIPVARELETGNGPIDVVLVNQRGRVALVECKLWRNPEARRKVVAQVLDYAAAISGWSTHEFERAVAKSPFKAGGSFREVFEGRIGSYDEPVFVDGLAETLSRARFLLLIVGDGIRSQVEDLARTISSTPQLGYHLALVEVGLYRPESDDEDTLVLIPEVVTRTNEVTRAVVEVRVIGAEAEVRASTPAVSPAEPTRKPITASVFFEKLRAAAGSDAEEFSRELISGAQDRGLRIQWMESGPIFKYDDENSGRFFSLGQLSHEGRITSISRLYERVTELGLPVSVYTDYLDSIIALLPNAHREDVTSKSGSYTRPEIIIDSGPKVPVGDIPMAQLVEKAEAVVGVMKEAVFAIQEATRDMAG